MTLPKRKSNRLLGYNYNQAGLYFVTICVKEKRKLLSTIVGDGVLCQEQDCKQLCKRIVNTFVFCNIRIWKPNGA